jgi:hypothetical protein
MERVFGIIPSSSGAYTAIWVISIAVFLVLVLVAAIFISTGYQSRHLKYSFTDEGLRISPGLYTRTIPWEHIERDGVKVLNLSIDTDYKLERRTNGAGMPGFASGWFRLANDEKALVFVTDRNRVVYIPTNQDYSVLLSVSEAEEFAGVLQSR